MLNKSYKSVDLQHHQLNAFDRSGCCWHETSSYVFQDGHYFKIYSEVDGVVGDGEKKTITRWVVQDGKAVEVKK